MFGTLPPNEIEQLLNSQCVGRIGCHAEGITYVVPLSYAYDGTAIYGHSFEGMKLDIMRKNPAICFQVDDMRDLANWQSVVAWGRFEEITDPEEQIDVLRLLRERSLPMVSSETMQLSAAWPFEGPDRARMSGVFFRLVLSKKTGRFEKANSKYYFAT